jgi:hypothetical protein
VWESPARKFELRGKEAAAENYRKMFASFKVESFVCLQRFATADRVVDDSIATVTLVGDGVVNAPAAVGSKVEIRLLHVFEMRDGLISRELVFESWKVIEDTYVTIKCDVQGQVVTLKNPSFPLVGVR